MTTLPAKGWTRDAIDRQLAAFQAADPSRRKTAMSIGINYGSDEIQEVLHRAHNQFAHNNNMVVFMRPGTQEMETELLTMAAGLLSGGIDGVVATISSGGTESIFNALHAAKRWAAATYPHITEPEIVAPFSAHAVLSKVATYLDIKVVRVPQLSDLRGDAEAMRAAVGPNTIALYASAPDWSYGYFDDIAAIGQIAEERDLWLHVDACVGGFVSPFADAIGESVPPWNFAVPGVRSISADLHKWGYALKPASVVAWRDGLLLQHAIVTVEDWPIHSYASPGFVGSRSAGPVAAAWAVMHHLGQEGYEHLTRRLMDAKRRYAERLATLPGVVVIEPGLVNINFRHETLSMEAIIGGMIDHGWLHFACVEPPMVSLYMDPTAIDVIEDYFTDLTDVIERGLTGDVSETMAGFYGGL